MAAQVPSAKNLFTHPRQLAFGLVQCLAVSNLLALARDDLKRNNNPYLVYHRPSKLNSARWLVKKSQPSAYILIHIREYPL